MTPQHQNEAFLREVQEEVRRDQVLDFWRRYGRLVIGGIIALLVAYAGALWWSAHQTAEAGRQGEQLDDAFANLSSNQTAAAQALLQPLESSSVAGYRALARFTQADIALRDAVGNPAKVKAAAAQFTGISNDPKVAEPMRQLAQLRAVLSQYDMLPPQQAINQLGTLATPGNPYFATAGELAAVAWLRLGHPERAHTLFSQIASDPATPDSVRSRVVQMAAATPEAAREQKAR